MPRLDVIEPARDTLLATVDSLRGRLQAGESIAEDRILDAIAAASEAFAGQSGLRRPPWRQTYRWTTRGNGVYSLLLPRWPVESIAVEVGGQAVTDYELADEAELCRSAGWPKGAEVVITMTAGWLMPGQVRTWAPGLEVAAGDWVRWTFPSLEGLRYRATVGGVTGADEPTWPAASADVSDGTVTWTAYPARELPRDLRVAAQSVALEWMRVGVGTPAGVAREGDAGGSVSYHAKMRAPWSDPIRRILEGYR